MSEVTVKLLGGFEARVGSGPALSFPTRKAKALLAYLAASPGKSHARSDLATLLWGNSGDEQARASLRQALTYLRNALTSAGHEVLVVQGDLVSVASAAVQVGVSILESLVAQETPEALERAAALYGGEFLEGFDLREPDFEDWLRDERAHHRKVVTEALKELLKHHMANDQSSEGLQVADRLLAIDPLLEDVHRAVMRLHLRQGQRILALKQYETCREVLQRELGIETRMTKPSGFAARPARGNRTRSRRLVGLRPTYCPAARRVRRIARSTRQDIACLAADGNAHL